MNVSLSLSCALVRVPSTHQPAEVLPAQGFRGDDVTDVPLRSARHDARVQELVAVRPADEDDSALARDLLLADDHVFSKVKLDQRVHAQRDHLLGRHPHEGPHHDEGGAKGQVDLLGKPARARRRSGAEAEP